MKQTESRTHKFAYGEQVDHKAEKIRRMRQAKRRQLRLRKMMLCVVTLALIILGSIGTHAFSAKAKSEFDEQTMYKYYKNIVIEPDDTLWDLAKANYCADKQSVREYIAEVQRINHLDGENIMAGSHIVLPYYSTEFVYY